MASNKSLNLTELFYKKSETRTRTEITQEIQDSIRDSPIIQGKVNKTDIVDDLVSVDTDKPLSAKQGKVLKDLSDTKASTTELNNLETSIDSRIDGVDAEIDSLETALASKVDKITGKVLSSNDYTTAEKEKLAGIDIGANRTVVDSALNPASTNPVQNKVICANFYDKADIIELLNNIETGHGKLLTIVLDEETGDLIVDDDGFDYYTKDEVDTGFTVNVEKQSSAESGYLATYVVKQGGAVVGAKINIPKDFLVKSASVKTATEPIPGTDIVAGDKYIDFVINSKSSTGTDEHLYLNVKSLSDVYTADESTLTLSNGNVFSIKSVPVSLINGVLPANQVTHQDITGKEDKTNKVSSWNTTPNNTRYPSEKLVKDSLDGKSNTGHGHVVADISDFPATMPPSTHKHNIADVNNLQTALDGKSATGHKHTKADITDFTHNHTTNEITDFPSTMPPSTHQHPISEVTNLQSALNGKLDSSEYSTVTLAVVFEDGTQKSYDLVHHTPTS